jgi:hypothetical protein
MGVIYQQLLSATGAEDPITLNVWSRINFRVGERLPEYMAETAAPALFTIVEKRAVGAYLEPVPLKALDLSSDSDRPFRISNFLAH